MVESACILAFSICSYSFLFLGTLIWFTMSIYKREPEFISSRSTESLWNLASSSILLFCTLAVPFIYLTYRKGYRGFSTFFLLIELVLTGPVLLGLNLVGSYLQALSFLIEKIHPYVSFKEQLCNILRDLHWSVLYFISLISTAVLIFCYYICCERYIFSENLTSLLPLRTLVAKSREECAICLEEIEEGEEVAEIKRCGHRFHSRCIENWIDINPRCPICRIGV